ncbi:hypothetical protein [Pseudoalteromonas piscicida]|uniref:Uncharacterized protein n=1 Tax=Pseudoalteromonas piscicida TaxID=43662 RepID=A0A2A5JJ71_PSEO7|nr:hypothetical protein [Pseudoalteromonas piscicida]PCK29508.1 hypothetical protein CEX98_22535 [Pseudoalteromonas piscicida]
MAIVNDQCPCGAKVVVFTESDLKNLAFKHEGFQVINAEDLNTPNAETYSLFSCENCGEPLSEVVPSVIAFYHPLPIGKNHGDA